MLKIDHLKTDNYKSRILYGKSIKIEVKLYYDLWETCEYLRISENAYFVLKIIHLSIEIVI